MTKNNQTARGSTTSDQGTYASPSWEDLRKSAAKEKDKSLRAGRLDEYRRDRAEAGDKSYSQYQQEKLNKLAGKDYRTNEGIDSINRLFGKKVMDRLPVREAKGGSVKKKAKGGSVSSASKRADGCATKGKTKGRFV